MHLLNLLEGRRRITYSKNPPPQARYDHDDVLQGTFLVSKRQLTGRKGNRKNMSVGALAYRAYVKDSRVTLVETDEVKSIVFCHPAIADRFLQSVRHLGRSTKQKNTNEVREACKRLKLAPSVTAF